MTAHAENEGFVPESGATASGADPDLPAEQDERAMRLGATLRDVAWITIVNIPLQAIATEMNIVEITVGLGMLYLICVLGVLLTKFVPFYLPSVAWISLVGIAATLPMLPWGDFVISLVSELDFLAMAVPALAYAGLAVSKRELNVMRQSGWKLLLVAIFVFVGTYMGSVLIAEFTLGLLN